MVWNDEFDIDGLPDATRWGYDVGGGGWGNQELQYYTEGRSENARVENGVLIIEAINEPFGGNQYTSARLVSRDKGDWRYGRIEVSAKLPAGRGTWPAIWMLPTDWIYGDGGWPDNGEIDIMEHVGFDPEQIHGTVHTDAYNHTIGTQKGGQMPVAGALEEFHEYTVEWTPSKIEFMVDDVIYFRFFNDDGGWPTWPFDRRFHLIMNIAVGGTWGGLQGVDNTIFPTRMEVDYVRVYENADLPVVTSSAESASDGSGSIELAAEASVNTGSIDHVSFLQGDGVLGRFDREPYAMNVESPLPGCYELSALAEDASGWTGSSERQMIFVGSGVDAGSCPQAPYLMQAQTIPGKVEAEYYDLGGAGVGYSDLDSENSGQSIRLDEGVDLERTADEGGGYNIGWIAAREWVEYTVDVEEAGVYDVSLRVASPSSGGAIEVEFDGIDKTGDVEFGSTGGWQVWETVTVSGITLDAGLQKMRLRFKAGAYNVNWVSFSSMIGTSNTKEAELPSSTTLGSSYPNPFTGSTTIPFVLDEAGHIILEVFNAEGRRISVLVDGVRQAGTHEIAFDASHLPGGLYFYRLTKPHMQVLKSMVHIK